MATVSASLVRTWEKHGTGARSGPYRRIAAPLPHFAGFLHSPVLRPIWNPLKLTFGVRYATRSDDHSEEAFMGIIRRHKRIAIFAVLAVFVMAGVAGAYWTQSGSGTGSASTGTTASITVNQTSAVSGLFPSASAPLSGNFTNPNTSPIFVHSVTAVVNPAFDVPGTGGKPDCTAADFTITGTANVDARNSRGPVPAVAGAD